MAASCFSPSLTPLRDSEEQVEHHRKGWELYLDRLATRVTGGDPGPDPNA